MTTSLRLALTSIAAFCVLTGSCAVKFPTKITPPANTPTSTMHPSWDLDGDGVNDCEKDGSCDHTQNYTLPKTPSVSKADVDEHAQPTFNCNVQNLSSVEKLICADASLAKLDQKMALTYNAALVKMNEDDQKRIFMATQRGWVKGRNECWKEPDLGFCIKKSYQMRQAEIEARHQLVAKSIAVRYTCNTNSQFFVTYYATTPATAIIKKEGEEQLLFRQVKPESLIYSNGDYIVQEHNGKAKIQWGYNTPYMNCSVKTD